MKARGLSSSSALLPQDFLCAVLGPSAPRRSPLAHRKLRPQANPDFRHRVPVPVPAGEEVEQQWWALLSPSLLTPRRLERNDPQNPQRVIRLRKRVLTLPVMVAIILSLVWRRLGALAEGQRTLAQEGLLGVAPVEVSEQALAKRLDTRPASVLAQVFAEVGTRLQAQPVPVLPGGAAWAAVRAPFPQIAVVEGSTLEALRKKTQALRGRAGVVLAGRTMVRVEAFTHRPLWQLDTEDAAANDNRFAPQILAALPVGGLLSVDLGFFSFLWFDDFTPQQKFFVTRWRQKPAYRTVQVLGEGPHYRAEIIELGQYRSPPCRQRVRLVSVLGHGQWYRYLTNVLDPQVLSARQVCEL
jgi:hypothetical protein